MAHAHDGTTRTLADGRGVTGLLRATRAGGGGLDNALPLVYDTLRRLARRALRHERPGHTLTPTGLAHEAYVRLRALRHVEWQNRDHLFATAMRAMQRVLVDHAVARRALKRGGDANPVALDADMPAPAVAPEEVLAVDRALARLSALAPDAARVVECRVFLGMTIEETAATLRVSPATVKRHWTAARAWLTRELTAERRDE